VRLYTVHAAPVRPASVPVAGAAPIEAPPRPPVLLPEGFCWPAFLFGPFWFAWHRLWWWAGGLLLLTVAAGLLLPEPVSGIVLLALHTLAGMEARDARRARLARRGMPELAVVAAPDLDTAWFRLMWERPDLVRALP
jgi:hypothetical protein